MMKHLFLTACLYAFYALGAAASPGQTVFQTLQFHPEEGMQGWTTADAGGDGTTWGLNSRLMGLVFSSPSSGCTPDDWAFSAGFTLTAGCHYTVETTVALRGAFTPAHLTLALADAPSATAGQTVISTDTYDFPSGMVTRRYHFVAARTGVHHLGLHLGGERFDGILSVKSVSIREVEGQCPAAAPDMTANSHRSAGEVLLKWYAPDRDTEGARIVRPMTAEITMDGTLVQTLTDIQPGSLGAFAFNPSPYSGRHTFAVAFSIDGHRGEAVRRMLNLNDFTGGAAAVQTFTLDSKTAFAQWGVQNGEGSQGWVFDYHSCYIGGSTKPADAWLFTPAVELESGRRYRLDYEVKTSRNYPADFDVTIGHAQDSSAHTVLLEAREGVAVNGYETLQSEQFEVDASGAWCFGFHATYVSNALDIRSVTVCEMEPEGGGQADAEPLWSEPQEVIADDNDHILLAPQPPLHTRLTHEGVELFAAFTTTQLDEYTLGPSGIFHLPYADGYSANLPSPDKEISLAGGCLRHDGRLYGISYDSSGNLQAAVPHWVVLDAETFEVMLDKPLPSNGQATTRGLAYCAADGHIYGLLRDYTDAYIVRIHPETGEMARITPALDHRKTFLTLSANAAGDLYAIYLLEDYQTGDQRQFLTRIHPADGSMADVGEIQGNNLLPGDLLYNMKYRQALVCDNSTGRFLWMFGSSSLALGAQYAAVCELDPLSAVATLRTWLDKVQAIGGAYLTEPPVLAPAAVSGCSYASDEPGSTQGTLTFTLPTTAYDGRPLQGEVSYEAWLEGTDKVRLSGSGMPGGQVECRFDAPHGVYSLHIRAGNSFGRGLEIVRTIVVGYDYPAAPSHLRVEEDGLTVTLRWDAPTVGLHGQAFDPDGLSYMVVRYPGYQVVAQGLRECRFSETLPAAISRYVYAVYSCCAGQTTEGVQTDMFVVGEPLHPPFGGVFRSEYDLYNYYTILDANRDRHTWRFDADGHSVCYPFNYAAAADDWLISPPLALDASKHYLLSFAAFSSHADYPESLRVTLGAGKTPEQQTQLLLDLPEVPAITEEGKITNYHIKVDVAQTSTYYYAFQACSAAYHEYLYLYDIRLAEDDTAGITPAGATTTPFIATPVRGGLRLANPACHLLHIYDAAGRLLSATSDAHASLQLCPGIYVVTAGAFSQKVNIR